MKRLKSFFKFNSKKSLSQNDVLNFMLDDKTIEKAAQGSMQKRNELLDRVELKHKHA